MKIKPAMLFVLFVILGSSFCVLAQSEISATTIEAIEEPIVIEVYRSASCGCCGRWITHLENNQFEVKDFIRHDMQAKKDQAGVPENMRSCHTAFVNGYVIEGHVPSADIRKLLMLKPKIIGIAVPKMPSGTPGMEMGKKEAYQVIAFDKDNTQVFTSHGADE